MQNASELSNAPFIPRLDLNRVDSQFSKPKLQIQIDDQDQE